MTRRICSSLSSRRPSPRSRLWRYGHARKWCKHFQAGTVAPVAALSTWCTDDSTAFNSFLRRTTSRALRTHPGTTSKPRDARHPESVSTANQLEGRRDICPDILSEVTATYSPADHAHLLRRGLWLEYVTLGWNIVGVMVLAMAALAAQSLALAGFGLDSLIEILASSVVIWQLTDTGGTRHPGRSPYWSAVSRGGIPRRPRASEPGRPSVSVGSIDVGSGPCGSAWS
jgi:hypothetical protein